MKAEERPCVCGHQYNSHHKDDSGFCNHCKCCSFKPAAIPDTELVNTRSAQVWAEQFLLHNPDRPSLDTLRAWFANAIEAGAVLGVNAHNRARRCVVQDWVQYLPMMQQTVLLTAIRGPDGVAKYSPPKMLLRWFRRCILLSAMDGRVLTTPYDDNGGSFTGPSIENVGSIARGERRWGYFMSNHIDEYLRSLDAIPHHFQMHFMHAVEILGYKHPDDYTRDWWFGLYLRLVRDMHVHAETCEELDQRLGDNRAGWLARTDPATRE